MKMRVGSQRNRCAVPDMFTYRRNRRADPRAAGTAGTPRQIEPRDSLGSRRRNNDAEMSAPADISSAHPEMDGFRDVKPRSMRRAARLHCRRASNRQVPRSDGSAASRPSSATIARVTSPALCAASR